MNRGLDEVVAGILIDLDQLRSELQKTEKRMDLTIKRVVKLETILATMEKRLSLLESKNKNED